MSESAERRKSEFICVEICIHTDFASDAFIQHFSKLDLVQKLESVSKTHKRYVYFQVPSKRNANTTILSLCRMIERLPPAVRKDWDRAGIREFSAGYHVGEEPHCFEEHIEPKTLKAALAVNAGIGIAMYPAPPPFDPNSDP
jgi:hypothetical protein